MPKSYKAILSCRTFGKLEWHFAAELLVERDAEGKLVIGPNGFFCRGSGPLVAEQLFILGYTARRTGKLKPRQVVKDDSYRGMAWKLVEYGELRGWFNPNHRKQSFKRMLARVRVLWQKRNGFVKNNKTVKHLPLHAFLGHTVMRDVQVAWMFDWMDERQIRSEMNVKRLGEKRFDCYGRI